MWRTSCFASLVVMFLASLAAQAGGVVVRFDPLSMEVGPFPADSLTVPDSQQKTGLRVNLPLPDCGAQPSSCQELAELNQLDGFNVLPRLRVRFSAPVNRHTLRSGIFLVWLDNLTNDEPGLRPTGYVSGINQVVYDTATNTAYAESDEVLDQHRRYALVVTDAVLDLASDPVGPDPAFSACVTSPFPSGYCSQLASALGQADVPGRPVAASLFTALSATSWLEKARAVIQTAPINLVRASPKHTFKLSDLLSITVRSQVRVSPVEFSDFAVPFPAVILPNVDRVSFGSFSSPRFLNAQQTIPATATAVPLTLPQSSDEIQFHALLPKTTKPAAGYPVVIFGHGLNDSRFGGPTLVANGFALDGLATIAINAAGHGSGPQSVIRLAELGRMTELPVGGRSVDLNGDGSIESREGCLIVTPIPVGLRDCLRQTVADLMQLVRAIRSGIDLDGDGSVDLDPNRIYYSGQSLGGLYGTILTALEPNVRAAGLNVGGGSVADIGRWSPSFRFLVKDYLAARNPPLLNAGSDFDEEYALRDQPVKVPRVPSAVEIQNVLESAEWFQMPGDPTAYAPHLSRSTLPGVLAKPVLWQFARGDMTVPNPQSSALIRGAGMRESSRLYRHDLARAVAPELSEDPHAFLVDIQALRGAAVAGAAQKQIAGFLTSDGTAIPEVNGPLRVLFAGNDLFETPARLPEDLGFSTGPVSVSAASYDGTALAPDSIASAFGQRLATSTEEARVLPLQTSLAGTTVRITDSAGAQRLAPLFFVSPNQVNFLLPPGTAAGAVTVTVTNAEQLVSTGSAFVEVVAPALFSANASGQGVAAAVAIRVAPGGAQTSQLIFQCPGGTGTCVADPLDLGPEGDQVYLLLFGTGIRGRSSLASVGIKIGGEAVPVAYAGPQFQYEGLDQVNVGPLPRSLAGRGEAQIVLVVEGQPANIATVSMR